MRVLCAIGVRHGNELVQRTAARFGTNIDVRLLHVIDVGPHRSLERLRGPLHHPPPPPPPPHHPPPLSSHHYKIEEAELAGGQAALDEASRVAQALGVNAETQLERGEPEHVIVAAAGEWDADVIVVQAREREGQPERGPASVGHIARFVLDHAPCDVMLLRHVQTKIRKGRST
jgi:nucleotide-binding universal stress UspA family protein